MRKRVFGGGGGLDCGKQSRKWVVNLKGCYLTISLPDNNIYGQGITKPVKGGNNLMYYKKILLIFLDSSK